MHVCGTRGSSHDFTKTTSMLKM